MARNKYFKKPTNIVPELNSNSFLLKLLINLIMKNGKKSISEFIIYNCLNKISIKTKKNPIEILEMAIKNIKPKFKLSTIKIKGIKSNIPIELTNYCQINIATKWLLESAQQRNEKGLINKLTQEVIDASAYIGNSIKKREQLYKQIEANKSIIYNIDN
jgi:small subunit ribosomal protein S7